jgi:hypothetical protein
MKGTGGQKGGEGIYAGVAINDRGITRAEPGIYARIH